MTLRKPQYDPACETLAIHFLSGLPRSEPGDDRLASLSQAIQNAVEDWFFEHPTGDLFDEESL